MTLLPREPGGRQLTGIFRDRNKLLPHLEGKRALLTVYPQKPTTLWAQFTDTTDNDGDIIQQAFGWTPFLVDDFDLIIPSN